MRTALLWSAVAALPTLAAGQVAATTETETVHGAQVTMDVVPAGAEPLMVVRLGRVGQPAPNLSMGDVAQSIGHMLDRLRAGNALPARFTIQFGALNAIVMPLLQGRLSQPGANWNMASGNTRHGSAYKVLPAEALAALADTPLAQAFTTRGYRLSPGATAEHVEVGRVGDKTAGRLPIAVGFLPIAQS